MPDNALQLADEILGQTPPPSIDQFADSLLTDVQPNGMAHEDRTATGSILADKAIGDMKVTAPVLPDDAFAGVNARVYPNSIGEAITEAGRQGITLSITPEQWDTLSQRAELLALQTIDDVGGKKRNVSADTWQRLVGAQRWLLTRLHSDMADEEKDTVLRNAGTETLGVALNRGFARLQELDTSLKQEGLGSIARFKAEQERDGLLQAVAQVQSWHSRLVSGDAAARSGIRAWVRNSLREHASEDPEAGLALSQLSSIFGKPGAWHEDPVLPGRERLLPPEDQIRSAVNAIVSSPVNPHGGTQVLRLSTKRALQQTKLQQLGLTVEEVDAMGSRAALFKHYPELVTQLAIESQRPLAPGEESADTLTAAANSGTVAGAIESLLTRASTPAQELERFQPERVSPEAPLWNQIVDTVNPSGAIGELFSLGMNLTERAVKAATATGHATTRGYGWELEPWKTLPADMDAVNKGIAAGNVDLGTFARVTGMDDSAVSWGLMLALEHLGGNTAENVDAYKWMATGQGIEQAQGTPAEKLQAAYSGRADPQGLGLGKILAERLSAIPEGVRSPELMAEMARRAFDELRESALGVEDARTAQKQAWREVTDAEAKGSFGAQVYATVKAAVRQTFWTDQVEMANLLMANPEAITPIAALGYVTGKAGGSFTDTLGSALNKGVARLTVAGRKRRFIKDLLATDQVGLQRLTEAVRNRAVKGLSEHQEEAIATVAEKLAAEGTMELRSAGRLTQETHDQLWKNKRLRSRELEKLMRSSGMRPDAMLNALDVPRALIRDLESPQRVSLLNEITSSVLDKLSLRGTKLSPLAAHRNFNDIAARLNKLIDEGASLTEVQDLPTNVLGPEAGERTPLQKLLNRQRLDVEKMSVSAEAGRWVDEVAPVILALRDHNVIVQGRQADLIDIVRRRFNHEEEALLSFADAKPEQLEAARAAINTKRKQLDYADRELKARGWREEAKLSKHDVILDNLTLQDLHLWWEASEGPGARHRLWLERAQRVGGQLESPEDFFARMRALEMEESELLNDAISGQRKAKVAADVRAAKKGTLQALFDREVPDHYLTFEDDTVACSDVWARRTKRHQTRLENLLEANIDDEAKVARYFETLESLPHVTNARLGERLQELNTLQESAEAGRFDSIEAKTRGWDFGRPADIAERIRQLNIDRKGRIADNMLHVQNFWEEYSKLEPKLRSEFDSVIHAAAEGDYKSWGDFFEKNPKVRARMGQGTKLENISSAFERLENLRASVLRHMMDTGQLSRAAYEQFVRPYNPHLYSVDMTPRMAGDAIRSRVEKHTGTARFDVGAQTAEAKLFEIQRDLYQTRVLIQQNGSHWVDRTFASKKEAEAFLHAGPTIKKDSIRPLDDMAAGVEGRTGLGDRFVILNPLPEGTAETLGLLPAGPALGQRVMDLVKQSAIYDVYKSIDRPGFVMTEAQWQAAQNSPAGRHMTRGFVHVKAPKGKLFEPLRGKYVHKKTAFLVKQVLETNTLLEELSKELSEAALSDTPTWAAGFAAGWRYVQGSGRFLRHLLSTNMIEGFLPTHIANRVYDSQILANQAAEGYLKSALGKRTQSDVLDLLLGFDKVTKKGKAGSLLNFNANKSIPEALEKIRLQDPELHDILRDGIRAGFIGDSLVGSNPMSADARRAQVEAFQGKTGTGLIDSLVRKKELAPGIAARERRLTQVTDLLQKWEQDYLRDPSSATKAETVARLRAEQFTLEEAVAAERGGLGGVTRRAVDGVKWFFGLKTQHGTFGEQQNFLRSLYQREGNIHRLGTYTYLRRLGHSHEYAANRVRTFMQDYSNIRGFARVLRNFPLANPVLSFPLEQLRIQANMVKHNPGYLLGWMAAAPAISLPSIIARGYDPVEFYKAQSGGNTVDALENATSTLYFAHPTHGLSSVNWSQMGPLQLLRSPMGILGKVTDEAENTGGVLGETLGVTTRLLSKVVGNPITQAGETLLTGRDAVSQEKIPGDILAAKRRAVEDASRLFVPGYSIWYGNMGRQLVRSLQAPPYKNTGRIVSSRERVLQAVLGIRAQGGALDFLDAQTGGVIGHGAQLLLEAANAAPLIEGGYVFKDLPNAEPINDEDLAAGLFYGTRKFSTSPDFQYDNPYEDIEDTLRLAAFYEAHGTKTEDTGAVAWAQRVRAQAVTELSERIADQRALEGFGEHSAEYVTKTGRRIMARQARHLPEKFASTDLMHQVTALIVMSTAGVDGGIIDNLTAHGLYTRPTDPDSPVRGWSDPAAIDLAIAHIERHLDSMPKSATGRASFLEWLDALSLRLPDAQLEAEKAAMRDEETANSWDEWERIQK